MKRNFGVVLILSVFLVGCGAGEPKGDIAPEGVKVERAGTGTGPQPQGGVSAPVAQPPAPKTPSD